MNEEKQKNTIGLNSLFKLKQKDLYNFALDNILTNIKNNINEFNIARLLQEKITNLKKDDEYILALQWIIYYSQFKNAKINHKSSHSRHTNSISISNWYIENWHEDELDRANMLKNMVFASAEHKIKAAIITIMYYEDFLKLKNLPNEGL